MIIVAAGSFALSIFLLCALPTHAGVGCYSGGPRLRRHAMRHRGSPPMGRNLWD